MNLDELDRVLDGARQAPLSEADYDKLKDALHAMAAMLVRPRNTEKTNAVVGDAAESRKPARRAAGCRARLRRAGHGRNGAEAFTGAQKVEIPHQNLKHGDRCPECGKGNVYGQKEPKVLVRIVGQAPLAATVYSLERLRCGACGQVFTAAGAGRSGAGEVRRDGGGDDRATQVRQRDSVLPAGTTGSATGDSVAGGDAVGDRGRGGRVDQAGAGRTDPAGGARAKCCTTTTPA